MKHFSGPAPIAYVLRKFPVMSETFVLNEILALEAQGVPVQIFSLKRPNDPHFHRDIVRLKAPITYVPDPGEFRRWWQYNRRAAKHYGRDYWRSLGRALLKGRPKLVWRFLQAGFVADRIRRHNIRHLHSHFATRPTTVAMLAGEITGASYSFTAHAYDIFKKNYRKSDISSKIRKAKFVVTVSEANRSYLERLDAPSHEKITIVPNGIDLRRFRPGSGQHEAPFTIVAVARLVEKKGVGFLIEACRMLRDRGLDFRCIVIGDGRQRGDLSRRIARYELRKGVQLLGARKHDEVLRWYHAADLFVLPSIIGRDGNREGLPVSIVEALACGVPVVSTPVGGVPEAVTDGVNGLIVPEKDATALAHAIQRTMENAELLATMRANARKSILNRFDRRKTVTSLCRLFAEEEVG